MMKCKIVTVPDTQPDTDTALDMGTHTEPET